MVKNCQSKIRIYVPCVKYVDSLIQIAIMTVFISNISYTLCIENEEFKNLVRDSTQELTKY